MKILKFPLMLIIIIIVLLFLGCSETDDGTYVEPISTYEKIKVFGIYHL